MQAREPVTPPCISAMTRKPAISAPAPQESSDFLSLDVLLRIAADAKPQRRSQAGERQALPPVVWSESIVTLANSLPVPMALPDRFPAKGPSVSLDVPGWAHAPKDLAEVNGPACPVRHRHDPLLTALRSALINDWHGTPIHPGPSAADGGVLPIEVALTVLGTAPELQKARKWAHTLTGSGQTSLGAQLANVSARYVIIRPSGITLVRDFYEAKKAISV